ncbi:MAG: type II toxin-antitoxin system prevent-host-death family antitoxin [Actinomycetota bacterium]|nr:type II toxin-antitoxin system prevent-host-death family antitoxin [Actinomycetota bacterium]
MTSIGIRELRQQASRYLRLVQAGETVTITDRGRPVALLVPVPSGTPWERLEAQGRLRPADADLLDLGEPLAPARGAPLPSAALEAARSDER